jgi:hypothetical protein
MNEAICCEKCGKELQIGDFPFCPHGRGGNNVIGDEIDELIENGLCWEDGSPRRFTSREEKSRALKEKNLVEWVEHAPERGSDKSPHTTRWI